MSLTFFKTQKSRPIAKIIGGKLDNQILYVLPEEDEEIGIKNIELPQESIFQPIPDKTKERDCGFITGASGSGKSYFTKKYVKEYQNMYNKGKKDKDKRPIYLFSRIKEDETLDSIKPLLRIKIGENLLNEPLGMEDFKNSLVIFDDTDIIKNKLLREQVNHLRDEILQGGRHYNISSLITNHNMVGKDLKCTLNESHFITFFPANYNRQLKYLLSEYLGLEKDQIKKIRKSKSRWITVFKTFPQVILGEREAYLPKDSL